MSKGQVVLVGGGCGRDLITLKGLKWIRKAEILIYDALIDDALINEAPDTCEKIYAGKRINSHSRKQDEINSLLYEKALTGKLVVRLKGGDSFVFGRGGEEFQYLSERGIEVLTVPGVSSCIAVPEEFGIPVSQRGLSQSFSVITGHSADKDSVDYGALARINGTLIFLMGGSRIGEIADKLISNGLDPDTPAAVLSRGFSDDGIRFDGILSEIGKTAGDVPLPAIFVIGKAAGLRLSNKFKRPPVTVTGTASFTGRVEDEFLKCGIEVEKRITLTLDTREALIPDDLSSYKWLVFTGANGVDVFFRYMSKSRFDLRRLSGLKIACVGEGTALRLSSYGLYPDLIPEKYTTEELAGALVREVAKDTAKDSENGGKLLILRAEKGSKKLNQVLDEAGIAYDDIKVYDTVHVKCAAVNEGILIFGSAEGVKSYFDENSVSPELKYVCIGYETAAALEEITGQKPLVAEKHTAKGVCDLVINEISKAQEA